MGEEILSQEVENCTLDVRMRQDAPRVRVSGDVDGFSGSRLRRSGGASVLGAVLPLAGALAAKDGDRVFERRGDVGFVCQHMRWSGPCQAIF
jgi:hypothetical protein